MALFLFEGRRRVAPFYHPSTCQLSTLEKTKLCHRSTSSSVLGTSFQQFVGGGRHRVAPFYHLSQLSHSRRSDFHCFSFFPGLSHAEDDRVEGALAIWLIIGLDFAVTPSSPESCCTLFAIPSEQTVELKWLMLNKNKR